MFMMSRLVAVSRLPVGSSAKMIEGLLMSALAMATRWIWPPESSAGLCVIRSPSPTFTSAAAALQAFRANPSQFDVVITDLNMPGTSGLDVVRELRTLRPELPVLLCSGHVTELMQAEAHSAGIRQVLYKPTTLADFSATLHHLFTQPRLPGPNL